MAKYHVLPFWVDAYLGDTTHLTTIEHGAYLLLIFASWRAPTCDLPDDDKRLARFAGLTAGQWRRMKPIIAEFFTIKDGRWISPRLMDEREAVRQKSAKASDSAKAKWRKHRDSANAVAMLDGCETDAPLTPSTEPTNNPPAANAAVPPLEKPKRKTGKRIAPDFQPNERTTDNLIGKGFDHDAIRRETENFIDYWTGEGGQRAAKLDWQAAFRVWCGKVPQQHRKGRMGTHPGQPTAPGRHKREPASFAQAAARVLAKIEDGQRSVGNGADTTGFPECDTDSPPLLLPGTSKDDH